MAVILIILTLSGLLIAALNGTRRKSQQVTCQLNNLKQLSLSWILYADDNDDQLALNRTDTRPQPSAALGTRLSTNSWVAGNPREDLTTDNIKLGTLFPYLRSPQLYVCPMDGSTVGKTTRPVTRSYSMSAYMNGDNGVNDKRVKQKLSDISSPSPSDVFVFIEEHENSSWRSSFQVLPRESFTVMEGRWSSTPSDRHNRGANLAFADGHVEYWKWAWPKQGNLVNLSASNVRELNDLRRLQNSIPKP
ncbi:MAG TPA: H-X9-DG-CTERM domain-containing protein [Methylomirabilota bacterium]|nr:H-X9-DG-CTERM domain-containing protein [Methylomirabilota bacterium]